MTGDGSPRDGHTFLISIRMRGASSIVGDPDSYRDSDWWTQFETVTIRAHSLREALHAASKLPLSDWFPPEEDPSE